MIDDFDTENEFVSEQVRKLALNALEQVLGGENISYSKDKVNSWCSQISDICIKELAKLNKPFKYVITSIIMQKNGCGLNSATTAFWDAKRDGLVSVQLQTSTFDCIVTIAGMSI